MSKLTMGKLAGLPPVCNLTHGRNLCFVGREQILQDLDRGFAPGAARRPIVLVGEAGTGKTSIAVEYAYSRTANYDIVWWVRGETQATMAADVAARAPRLVRDMYQGDGERQACNIVLDELQRRERWLMIFDNVQQGEDLASFLPANAAGHVLITSGNIKGNLGGASILVEGWSRAESVEFLRKRLNGIDDRQAAEKVATALHDLPLALEQAASCMEQAGISVGDYLGDYETLWADMLGQGMPAGQYSTAIAMAWELSFRRIEIKSTVAAQLLTLCSFFGSQPIPLKMIQDGSESLDGELALVVKDPLALQEAMDVLQSFGLAEADQQQIIIHGVIAAMAQDRLARVDRGNWAAAAVRIASTAFPFDSQDPATWPACARSLSHVLAATMAAQAANVEANIVADLLNRAGRFLTKQAHYSEARGLLEMAYTLVKQNFGEKTALAADVANNLARVRHRLGDLVGASTLYELALQIDAGIYGPTDPHLATVANNSAMTMVEMGRPQAARERFEWALQVYRQVYPKDHPKVASVMNNLGYVLAVLKQDGRALEYLQEAFAMTEATCGQGHPQIACIAVNLGMLLKSRNRVAEARELYERALLVDEAAFGGTHPAVGRDLTKLGQLLCDQGDFEGAARHLERALPMMQTFYGREHRETAECLNELGRAMKGLGNTDRAVDCLTRAAEMIRKSAMRPHETIVGDEGMLA